METTNVAKFQRNVQKGFNLHRMPMVLSKFQGKTYDA